MAKANFPRAKDLYKSCSMDEADWLQVIEGRPDIMWSILGDIYNVVKDQEDRESGVRRMGRRPTRAAGSIDELWRTVFPTQFSLEPFPVAFTELLAGRPQRRFASKVPCDQSTISKLLSGKLIPDKRLIEAVAAAGDVPPHYFVEWRAMHIAQLVGHVLASRPALGVTAIKRLQRGDREAGAS